MHAQNQANEYIVDLYRLAFLLTGRSGLSIEIATDVCDLQSEANPFFSGWMKAWSRKVVISKALTCIRKELAASAKRLETRCADRPALPPRNWTLDPATTRVQLERALLAIDVFPRCVLLLSVFEGLTLEDTGLLVDADRKLTLKGQTIGLQELPRNLAQSEGWNSSETMQSAVACGV